MKYVSLQLASSALNVSTFGRGGGVTVGCMNTPSCTHSTKLAVSSVVIEVCVCPLGSSDLFFCVSESGTPLSPLCHNSIVTHER